MIPASILKSHLQMQPFVPFRIVLTGGKTIEVRHPEMVRVRRATFIVFEPDQQDSDLFDTYNTVSLLLVERIEHREPKTVA
jgi:hypothetical protein